MVIFPLAPDQTITIMFFAEIIINYYLKDK